MGKAWEITPRDVRLHQSHADAGGARALASRPARKRAAAPPADHLRNQSRASWTRSRSVWPGDADDRAAACRSSRKANDRQVRMAHLAIVGSHSINGVSALHTELVEDQAGAGVLRSCGRSASTTRPTASRRGAGCCMANPGLAQLLDEAVGNGWITDLDQLRGAGTLRGRPGVPGRLPPRSSATTRNAWPRSCIEATAVDVDAGFDLRRPGQAHPRVQAPAPNVAAHRPRVPAPGRGRRRTAPCRRPICSRARPRRDTGRPSMIIKLINIVGAR